MVGAHSASEAAEVQIGHPAGDGVPPPPELHHVLAAEMLEKGSRYRLGYVNGFQSYYGIWDLATGHIDQFPLTEQGWEEAWLAYSAREREDHARGASPFAMASPATPLRGEGRSSGSQPGPWTSGSAPGRAVPFPAPPSGSRGSPTHPGSKPRLGKIAGVVIALLVGLGAVAKLGVLPLPGQAIIKESFSSPNGHWVERSDALVQAGFVDGTYQILVRAPNLDFQSYRGASNRTWPSVQVEADAHKADSTSPEGAYGVSCVVDEHTGYVFLLDPDAGSLAIVRVQNSDGGAVIQQATDLTAMNPGDGTNRIRGECVQAVGGATSLTMSVNGKQVLQASDPNGLTDFSGMGLWAATRTGGTDVRFDNALMKKA